MLVWFKNNSALDIEIEATVLAICLFIPTNFSLSLCSEKNSSEAESKEQQRWGWTCYLPEIGGRNFPWGIKTSCWGISCFCISVTGVDTSFFLFFQLSSWSFTFPIRAEQSAQQEVSSVQSFHALYYVSTCTYLFIICKCARFYLCGGAYVCLLIPVFSFGRDRVPRKYH